MKRTRKLVTVAVLAVVVVVSAITAHVNQNEVQ